MRDQTVFGSSNIELDSQKIEIYDDDKAILKDLAKRLHELANRPEERDKIELWTNHNDLKETRPLVFCDPENGWNEIVLEQDLKCQSSLGQDWEVILKKEIVWATDMGDDRVALAMFDVPYVAKESDWGMHEKKIGGDHGGAYTWEAPLKDFADMDKMHFPQITVDYAATEYMRNLAEEIFGDYLEVRVKHAWWWTLGLTWTLVNLRGLEQVMFDMYDYPQEMHKLMAYLRDGHLAKLDFLERNGLLPDNTAGTYVGSGGFGWTNELPQEGFDPDKVRLKDMWGFGESQETTSVAPDMFAEFILPYQMPILEKFGLNCYGCCEPLNQRWDYIKKIPNLRRVSVSPWADIDVMAQQLENKYVFSYKPNPAHLAVANLDEDLARESLRDVIRKTKGCRLEIIMKDNNTLGGNPQNAYRWVQIAKEEARNLGGV
jgi:hypothetical protein